MQAGFEAAAVFALVGIGAIALLGTETKGRTIEHADDCTRGPTVFYKQANVTGLEWTNCQGNAILIEYRISGEGHVWPHVRFNKPGGTAVSSLSASALIWSFFQQHPLPAPSPTG